jgi:hypothetical protein
VQDTGRMTKADVEARRTAKFKRQMEGPPRVVAVATPREGMEHWRERIAAAGLDVAVTEEKEVVWPEGGDRRGRLILENRAEEYAAEIAAAKPPPEEAASPEEVAPRAEAELADAPLRITIHRPKDRRTVRIETGPEGTEIHLDG